MDPIDPHHLYDQLWRERFEARYLAALEDTEQRRQRSWLATPRLVAGWPIRQPTPYDLLIMEHNASPFVLGRGLHATPDHLGFALWYLRAETSPAPGFFTSLRREIQIRRWRRQWLTAKGEPTGLWFTALAEFNDYFDEAFADSELPRTVKTTEADPEASAQGHIPHGTHWIASQLTALCMELGPRDPVNDLPWAHVPLSQVFQYRREIDARHRGQPSRDGGELQTLRNECMVALNEALAKSA